ncbi:CoA transferase [Marinobacter sp. G11]|uniref:CaiB/BaiF CoA transferase family protein n=1 Tax=Marinobacter sp. G11 TaxID=2903522 RepID=UPI001E32E854|nr:CaiB/BaiF CoA-transferase family protein [Marinobacter sp. G11]MCE0760781.1 CoA transferase [Marinobacter sp. G11]
MGPLEGVKVVEFAGIGPAPIVGMLLADLGAQVVLIERKVMNSNAAAVDPTMMGKAAFFKRGKKSVTLNLREPSDVEVALSLVAKADVLVEGFRPGVMERLGIGPAVCLKKNPRLIYGRMTGWGQTGPLAPSAGHDLNFSAITGALSYGGLPGDIPFPTPTLQGDVGGGSMSLALGILSALFHVNKTGRGQVIDAAISDGVIYNMMLLASLREQGVIGDGKRDDFFSGVAPWCSTYRCADDRFVTVQALEPNFYHELISICGFSNDPDFVDQNDKSRWERAKKKMAAFFGSRTQAECCSILEGTDACFAPVLNLSEAENHPHNQARESFICIDGVLQPAPAPKFSLTKQVVGGIPTLGEHNEDVLGPLGLYNETKLSD